MMSHTLPSFVPVEVLLFIFFNHVYLVLNSQYFIPVHSSIHLLRTNSLRSSGRLLFLSFGFYCDLICLCRLHDCHGMQDTQSSLSFIPSINLHTLLCLPRLTPSFLINRFMISSSQEWAWSVAKIYILVTWSLRFLSLSLPLEQRSSIFIQSTPPSVYLSHVKPLSREDVPWVSVHPPGFIWNRFHFIRFSYKFARRAVLPTRGRRTISIFRVSFQRPVAGCDCWTFGSRLCRISSAAP